MNFTHSNWLKRAATMFALAAFLCPLRQERDQPRARSGIRILINRDIYATSARFSDQAQGVYAAPPVAFADDLVMRHLRGQSAALADGDGFFNAFEHT